MVKGKVIFEDEEKVEIKYPCFENHWFVTAMIAWFIVAGFDLWYIEKSDRYYKK